jgi:hypothetical protein
MAITINDPPIFVFWSRPAMPRAKIVGNMTDMKKLVTKMAHRPTQPGKPTPTATSAIFTRLYTPIKYAGLMNRIKAAELNLPTPKATRVPVRK